jgi:hypothetical protein
LRRADTSKQNEKPTFISNQISTLSKGLAGYHLIFVSI